MHRRSILLPRRPASVPHHEAAERKFENLSVGEAYKPARVAPVIGDDDVDFPDYMRADYPDRISAAELNAPAKHHKRKL